MNKLITFGNDCIWIISTVFLHKLLNILIYTFLMIFIFIILMEKKTFLFYKLKQFL